MNLKALKENFMDSWSETSDDHANNFYFQALDANTREAFERHSKAATRRAHASYVKSQLRAPDDWSYSRLYQILDANAHNLHLVTRALNGMQHTDISAVNPLGYVMTARGEILKIMVVDVDSRTVGHTLGYTLHRGGMVNWFMPEAAPTRTVRAGDVMGVLAHIFNENIDPRNFNACLDSLQHCVLSKRCIQIYVDFIWGADGDFWREAAVDLRHHVAECMAHAMFADVGTPNPFDYPAATVKGMGL